MPPTELPEGPPRAGAGGESPLTRKIGPLPAWGWAVVVAGAVLVARALGGKRATGGESVPGTIPVGDVGDGGSGTGETVVPGSPGPQGPPGAPGTLPTGYSAILNQITDWFQQLAKTNQLIANLKSQLANTDSPTKRKAIQAKLDKATGKTPVAGGKFTSGTTTYYQQSFITTTINELQSKLKALPGA
jgi:hypothetical protein